MLLVLAALLAASTPAASEAAANPATPPAAVATARAATAAKKDDEMVCRTEEVTGSRFPKKICRTRAQAARDTADQQQQIRENQRILVAPPGK